MINEWFGRTIINSDKRFSYNEAQQVIDTGEGDMKEQVLVLHKLAQQLRTKRFASGAFAFEKIEVKFDLDEAGKPLGIKFREMGTANQLIEEFMLLANKRVAEYVGKKLRGKHLFTVFTINLILRRSAISAILLPGSVIS